MSGALLEIDDWFECLEWFDWIEWFGWFDLADFGNNVVTEVLALLVGLYVVYKIIDSSIKRREKEAWKPARRRLLSMLRRQCEGALIAWARNTKPPRLELSGGGLHLSNQLFSELANDLSVEVKELEALPQDKVYEARPTHYWRSQVHGLATIKESLRLAIDRAQLTLRDEPELVEAVANLEIAYIPVPGLDAHLAQLERLEELNDQPGGTVSKVLQTQIETQLRLGASMTVIAWKRFLLLLGELQDVPGMVTE